MPEFLAQLVTCGIGNAPPCRICDIWVLADKVVNFVYFLATPILVIIIIAGGFIYLTSGGNPKKTEQAKSLLSSAIVGIIIALAAFLIVDTILKTLVRQDFTWPSWKTITTNSCPKPLEPEKVDLSKLPRPEIIIPPGNYQTDAEIRSILTKEGIRINKNDCPSALQQTNCTSLSGLPKSTLNYILELDRRCDSVSLLCGKFVITSGTEGEGTIHKTHGVGKPIIDIAPDRSNPTMEHYKILRDLAKTSGAVPNNTFCEKPNGTISETCAGADHIHVVFPR